MIAHLIQLNTMLRFMVLVNILCISIPMARETIALADLNAQGIDVSASSIISDRLRNDLFETGLFTVVERSQMDQILKEQGFQQSGCTSDACAVEVGQLLGVQYIIVGSVGKLGKTYTVNVRLIDVKTGMIIRSAAKDCRCEIDDLLKRTVPEIAKQLSSVVEQQTKHVSEPAKPGSLASDKSTGTTHPLSPALDLSARSMQNKPDDGPKMSTQHALEKPKKNRLAMRILTGALTLGGAGAGLYFNNFVQTQNEKRTALHTDYINAAGAMSEQTYQSQSDIYKNRAKSASLYRTISYITAGLGAVGFTLTFVF